jgi:hypothetical protein
MKVRRVTWNPETGESTFHTRQGGIDYLVYVGSHSETEFFYIRVVQEKSGELVFEGDSPQDGEARLTVLGALHWAESEIRARTSDDLVPGLR